MKPNSVFFTRIDKDQLAYDSNFNPENVSYNGPRTIGNQEVITDENTVKQSVQ